jgi:hypothetical protein
MSVARSRDTPARDGPRLASILRLHDLYDAVLLLSAAVVLAIFTIELAEERPEIGDVTACLAANGALAWIGFAICLRRQYPILMTSFYFDFIFFALAPLQQLRLAFDPIFGDDHALYMALLTCIIFTAIAFGALWFRSRPLCRPRIGFFSRTSCDVSSFHPLVLCCAVLAVECGLLAFYGASLFSSREGYGNNLGNVDKSVGLFFTTFFNPFVMTGSVVGLLCARDVKKWPWFLVFVLLFMLAATVNNPIVTARFRVSALMCFTLLAFVGWNNTRILSLFLVTGMIASPIFNSFRTEHQTTADVRTFDTFFAHMDYDAFAITSYVVRYVGEAGYGYGGNTLAAFLFFVPRALWTAKSEPVGHYVWPQIRYYRHIFTDNLSSPPTAEGFYDFGLVGAILLTVMIFAAFVLLERRAEAAQRHSPLRLIVCLAPMLTLIMLRGALIVGYSESCGNAAALLTAIWLLRVKIRMTVNQPAAQTSSASQRIMPPLSNS